MLFKCSYLVPSWAEHMQPDTHVYIICIYMISVLNTSAIVMFGNDNTPPYRIKVLRESSLKVIRMSCEARFVQTDIFILER